MTTPRDAYRHAADPDYDDDIGDDIDDVEVTVADDLDFGTGFVDDTTADDDPINDAIPIRLGGMVFELNRPADSALALRAAELYNAETLLEQYHAMMGIIQTSLDLAGVKLLRQYAMGPRTPGKKFDDAIVGKICETILQRWGGGRPIPDPKPVARNRAERRSRR